MVRTLFKRKDGFWEWGWIEYLLRGSHGAFYPNMAQYHPSGESDFY